MSRITILVAILCLGAAACADPASLDPGAPETTSPWTADGTELIGTCGSARFAIADAPTLPSEPLSEAESALLDAASEEVAVEWEFAADAVWAVSHRTDDTVVLFGTVPSDDAPYVYASVEVQSDGSWALAGWGQCSLTVAAEGYSTANWILDPDVAPAPGASSVSVWVMERECAGGEPPVGRDIVPVVFADEGTVRMIVLIEQLEGDATCPSNPWYPVELDLGEPIGDRTLVDASVMPPLERPWPPSEASIQDPRDA